MKLPVLDSHRLLPKYLNGTLNPSGLYQPDGVFEHPYCYMLEMDWLSLIHQAKLKECILGVEVVLIDYLLTQNGRPDLRSVEFDPDYRSIVYYKSRKQYGETTGLTVVNHEIFVASPPFAVRNGSNAIFIHWPSYSTLPLQVESIGMARKTFNPLFSLLVRHAGFTIENERILNSLNQDLTVI